MTDTRPRRRRRSLPSPTLCAVPHPTIPDTVCTRLAGHEDHHNGYTFAVTKPQTWSRRLCRDCGTDCTPGADHDPPKAIPGTWQWYIVHDDVWAAAGMNGFFSGLLCIGCLEKRLGRRLTGADLPDHLGINRPNNATDTPYLAKLKQAAQQPRRLP